VTFPVLSAGHKVLGTEWDTILKFVQPLYVRKTADQTVTSSTTIGDDSQLLVAVDANATYEVWCHIIYTAGTVGDLKIGWSGPTSATFDWVIGGADAGSTAIGSTYRGANTISGTDVAGGPGSGNPAMVTRPSGVLITSSTSGTFKFRWAQGTSDATSTVVKSGSIMALRRLA
jgi:hypothetical protein